MKRTTLLIIILVTMLLATPVMAGPKAPTGDRIFLYLGDQSYPAHAPFYVSHGWGLFPTWGDEPGQFRFELEVDGLALKPSYVERWTEVTEWGPALQRSWVFNFPDGMTGEHTFVGSWIGPCWVALDWGLVAECAHPLADTNLGRAESHITFE